MGLKFSNNSEATLASSIGAGDTALTITPGQGIRFPEVDFAADGDFFFATLVDLTGNREVIKVKEHVSATIDQFTIIERAADAIQEGTPTAYAFTANDKVQLRLPAIAVLSPDSTKSDSFIIGSDTSGPRLKNSSSELQIRNLADSAFANLYANDLTLSGALALAGNISGALSITMSGALSGVTSLSMGGTLSGVTSLSMGGHLTGAVNVTASGIITGEHLFSTDDAVITNDLTVNGAFSAADPCNLIIDNEASAKSIKARDHGTASDPEVVNVVYGTGTPPSAASVPEGTIWLKYV